MVCGGRCYVHMLNAACLSPFSVPCHRYHLTQGLFRGQLFQAIESRSKPALCLCDSVFTPPPPPLFLTISPLLLLELRRKANPPPQPRIINHKYDQLARVAAIPTTAFCVKRYVHTRGSSLRKLRHMWFAIPNISVCVGRRQLQDAAPIQCLNWTY